MMLLLMLMLQGGNLQFVGVARENVSKEESDYTEPCHDLGRIQVECTAHQNCIQRKQLENYISTLERCRTECQRYQDLDSPCVFFVFRHAVLL